MLKQTERSAMLRKELAEVLDAMQKTANAREGTFVDAVEFAVLSAQVNMLDARKHALARQIAELEAMEFATNPDPPTFASGTFSEI